MENEPGSGIPPRDPVSSPAEPVTSRGTKATHFVWYVLGLIEILLALRFVFKLLGANPLNGFVTFIYGVTAPLTAPFDTMFGVKSASNGMTVHTFEPSIVVAAVVYALVAWGIAKLISISATRTA